MEFSNGSSRKSILRRLADTFTLFRVAVGFPIIISLHQGYFQFAWVLILFGGLSDIADGYLARAAGGGTVWGARLDPLADKILLSAPLLWLASNSVIPIWSIWFLISRELIITSWRSYAKGGGKASIEGKVKTILQFTSVLMLIWPDKWGEIDVTLTIQKLGWYLFWLSILMAFYSAARYIIPRSSSDPN